MGRAGKYTRLLAGWIVGAWVAWLVIGMVGRETRLTAGIAVLVILIMGGVSGVVATWLRRYRWLDPEGWAERERSKNAASATKHLTPEAAARKIRLGDA